MTSANPQFISESIVPLDGPVDTAAMARGEPGLPNGFTWREQHYEIVEVLDKWKESGSCRHGSGEQYLRKHWYKVKTDDNRIMTIYFERQARSAKQRKDRWWLYTISRE